MQFTAEAEQHAVAVVLLCEVLLLPEKSVLCVVES